MKKENKGKVVAQGAVLFLLMALAIGMCVSMVGCGENTPPNSEPAYITIENGEGSGAIPIDADDSGISTYAYPGLVQVESNDDNSYPFFTYYVDPETGAMYVYSIDAQGRGGLTPMFERDGSLKVHPDYQ